MNNYTYTLLKANVWTEEAEKYGLTDERRYYLWWEVLAQERRGRLTAAEVEELHRDIWLVTRVSAKSWWWHH